MERRRTFFMLTKLFSIFVQNTDRTIVGNKSQKGMKSEIVFPTSESVLSNEAFCTSIVFAFTHLKSPVHSFSLLNVLKINRSILGR